MITAHATRLSPELELITLVNRKAPRCAINVLELALDLEEVGDLKGARALLNCLEQSQGVTEDDRFAARSAGRPFLRIGNGAEEHATRVARQADRERVQRDRATALNPVDTPPFSDMEYNSLVRAEAKLAEGLVHKAAGNFRLKNIRAAEARALYMSVQDTQRSRTNSRWAERVLKEITALEEANGGTVRVFETGDGRAPRQVASRDGLYTLSIEKAVDRDKNGEPIMVARISKTHLAVGLRYRDLYEKTDPERSLKPAPIDPSMRGGIGGGGDGYEAKRRKWWDERLVIDKRIKKDCGDRGLVVLQEVAGKGRCISHIAGGSRARERDTVLLVAALDSLADAYGL